LRFQVRSAFLAFFLLALLAWLILLLAQRMGGVGPASSIADRQEAATPAAAENAGALGTVERATVVEPAAPTAPAAGVAAVAPPETLLFGNLLDPAREPIRGGWYSGVSLTDQAGVRRYAKAGPDGDYSFADLEFGTYWASAGAEGYRGLEETLELRPDVPVVRMDFVLQPAVVLRIRLVTPEGGNLFEALREVQAPEGSFPLVPVATREPPGERIPEVFGSKNDHFGAGNFWDYGPRVDRLPPGYLGILVLDGDLPAWVSLVHNQVVLQSQTVLPGQEEVSFVLAPEDLLAGLAEVRVQLTAVESGLPISTARATLLGGAGGEGSVATDLQGLAVFERREPGLFEMLVQAEGFEQFRCPVDAPPGAVTDLGTIALERELCVEGRVLDLEDRPRAATFTLGVLDAQAGEVRWFWRESFQSGSDGVFRLRGLGRREYAIRTSNHDAVNRQEQDGTPWVSGIVTLDARAAAAAGLVVRLRPATRLLLRVAGEHGDGMRFRVLDERGLALVASRFYGPGPRPLLLPDGNYRVQLLDAAGLLLSERPLALGRESVTLDLSR
jgi:hypothetical protein